jgi:WD40 repeat protein
MRKLFTKLPVAVTSVVLCAAADTNALRHFLIANDDSAASLPPSTVSFFAIGTDGSLHAPTSVSTGGNGMAGGYFGIERVIVTTGPEDPCIYASNAQSENIAGIDFRTRELVGLFRGSRPDNKLARNGIGMAIGGSRLYATFSGSGNIGEFAIQRGCKLQFIGEVHAEGLHGGTAEGIAIRGDMMVVTYGDGSVESFDISGTLPVSHGDAQYSSGSRDDLAPGAVDITSDGHYAIFGGGSTASAVEVSDISSGKLTTTKVYHLGAAWNSGSVRLSPDERVLYVSNSSAGRVTAAFFDRATGAVRPGCTSAPLKGYYSAFTYLGEVATELATGMGGLLYVPELGDGRNSYIGVLRFTSNGKGCTIAEAINSPVAGSPASKLLSIGVFPPRPF